MFVRGFDMFFNAAVRARKELQSASNQSVKACIGRFITRRLLLGTCLTPFLAGSAFALPPCGPGATAVQTCSGTVTGAVAIAEAGLPQLTVTTQPGFSVTQSALGPAALSIFATGSVSFTDENAASFINNASPSADAIFVDALGAGNIVSSFSSNGRIDGGIYSFAQSVDSDASLSINLDHQTGAHFIEVQNNAFAGAALTQITATGDIATPTDSANSGIMVTAFSKFGSTVNINANNITANGQYASGVFVQSYSSSEADISNKTTVNITGAIQAAAGFGLQLSSSNYTSNGNARSDMDIAVNSIASKYQAITLYSGADSYLDYVFNADAANSSVRLKTSGAIASELETAIAIQTYSADQYVTIGGAVTGGNGAAIDLLRGGSYEQVDQALREQNAIASSTTLELHPNYALNGSATLLAQGWSHSSDPYEEDYDSAYYFALPNGHLVLGGSGTASFDLARIDNRANAVMDGAADRISGFGTLSTSGDAQWSLIGSNDRDANDAFLYANVKSGRLTLDNAHLALRATTPDLVLVEQPDVELPTLMMMDEGETPAVAPDLSFVAAVPDGSSAGALTIGSAGTLAVNGASSVIGNVINAGLVLLNPCPTCAGNVLTVTGNYQGNGGVVSIGTILGDDSSPTDKLVIEGNSSGTSIVKVNNEVDPLTKKQGAGALTREGIEIITIGGSSDGTFTLAGNYVTKDGAQAVTAGAYAYRLLKGNASGTDSKDWYLRSELKPVDPDDEGGETPVTPELQTGAPIYETYAQSLLGMNGVATLQQRVGNRVWAANGNRMIAEGADAIQPVAPAEEAGQMVEGNGVWGRVEGTHSHIEPKFSTTDTDYNQNVFKLQAGIDGKLSESETGSLIGGVFVHYVHGKTKTSSTNYADGEIVSDGYGFGGSLTFYGDRGIYVDAQAQATWYSSDLTTSALGAPVLKDGNDGFGYALSLEAGQRFAVNEAWSLTPQAQLVYSRVDFDSFTDGFGSSVGLDKGDSLQGRLGLTLDHENSWQNAKGTTDRSHVYGIVNLYSEFLDGTRVDLAGVSLASNKDRTWGGIGAGGSYNWDNDKYSIYGEGLINTSLNNFGESYSLKGNVGFRVRW